LRRTFPTAIAITAIVLIMFTVFVGFFTEVNQTLDKWFVLSTAVACCVGLVNLTSAHFRRVLKREKGWDLSVLLLVIMYGMLVTGLFTGPSGTVYDWVFQTTAVPLGATFFSVLAFYIVSAAYRAFRARTFDAAVLLLAALIVLMGRAPLGQHIWPASVTITSWIMNVPNTAGMRAVAIGTILGSLITGVRILLGLDRPYLSKNE